MNKVSQNGFNAGLSYEGKVTLTLKSNGRVLKSQTYKNNGAANLFKFLGHCLIGHYEDVKSLLPTKIALLKNGSDSPNSADFTKVTRCSSMSSWAQTPSIISTSDPAEVRVIYSFELGKDKISGDFNQVALYGAGLTDPVADIGSCSAYYYLANSARNAFATEEIGDWSDTTVLVIDWELHFSNTESENT
jgi:hypothetical protein